jgi:hypothetical protein
MPPGQAGLMGPAVIPRFRMQLPDAVGGELLDEGRMHVPLSSSCFLHG